MCQRQMQKAGKFKNSEILSVFDTAGPLLAVKRSICALSTKSFGLCCFEYTDNRFVMTNVPVSLLIMVKITACIFKRFNLIPGWHCL